MRVRCETCGEIHDDEYTSTICPHRGLGYCRGCDCVVCVCSPDTTKKYSEAYRTPRHNLLDSFSRELELPLWAKIAVGIVLLAFGWYLGGVF